MGAARRRNGKLEVATDTYVKDGRHVILFGVTHIASHSFWLRTNNFLAKLEGLGYHVHYERVISDMENPPKLIPDYKLMAECLDLQDQRSGMRIPEHWKNTDITMSRLISKATPEQIARFTERAEKTEAEIKQVLTLRESNPEAFRLFQKTLLVAMGTIPMASHLIFKLGFNLLPGIENSDIVNRRNGIAFQEIVKSKDDIVTVWGANHLEGIGGALVGAAGFKLKYRQWHPAF